MRLGGDQRAAVGWAERAEQTALALGDEVSLWRARLQKCQVEYWSVPTYQTSDALTLTGQAIEVLTAAGDDAGLALAYQVRSDGHLGLGHQRAAAFEARQGLRHAHRAGRGVGRPDLTDRVMYIYHNGDGSLAEERAAIAELEAEFGQDRGMDMALDRQRILLLAHQGRLDDQALPRSRDLYNLHMDQGSTIRAAGWLGGAIAWCQRWSGDLTGASQSLVTAVTLLENAGETGIRSTVLAKLGMILALRGREDQATDAIARSRAISVDDDLINDVYHIGAEGLLHSRHGDAEACEQCFDAALRIAGTTEFLPATGELWLARSVARERLENPAGALTAAREALACFERKGHVPLINTAQTRIAELGG